MTHSSKKCPAEGDERSAGEYDGSDGIPGNRRDALLINLDIEHPGGDVPYRAGAAHAERKESRGRLKERRSLSTSREVLEHTGKRILTQLIEILFAYFVIASARYFTVLHAVAVLVTCPIGRASRARASARR